MPLEPVVSIFPSTPLLEQFHNLKVCTIETCQSFFFFLAISIFSLVNKKIKEIFQHLRNGKKFELLEFYGPFGKMQKLHLHRSRKSILFFFVFL